VEAFYEPDWRSGKSVPTRIQRQDGKPMGIAGLWSGNSKALGREVLSFTMLTVNADHHEVMQNFHRPGDEKRMVVILDEADYDSLAVMPSRGRYVIHEEDASATPGGHG
jgi:putative SOS response-associated peptidase YedK